MIPVKAIVALVMTLVIAGGLWYVTGLRADLAMSEMNNKKLEEGIASQQAVIEQMKADVKQIQEINADLQAQNTKLKEDSDKLAKKFDKRDFGVLANAKPKLVERLVNRGTVNAMRCLEIASGSPLNKKEQDATSPTKANSECPSLINPNSNSPIN